MILGDGSDRQDRVEIEISQNETEGVMFIDLFPACTLGGCGHVSCELTDLSNVQR